MVVGEMGIRVTVRKWGLTGGKGNGFCHFIVVFRDLRRPGGMEVQAGGLCDTVRGFMGRRRVRSAKTLEHVRCTCALCKF
jgi:hypothetical protein